jgi:hypothetical protein
VGRQLARDGSVGRTQRGISTPLYSLIEELMTEFQQSECYLVIRTGARQPKTLLRFSQEIAFVVPFRHGHSAMRLLIPIPGFLAGLNLSRRGTARLYGNGLGV